MAGNKTKNKKWNLARETRGKEKKNFQKFEKKKFDRATERTTENTMAEVPAPETAPEVAPEAAAAVEKEAPKTPTRVQPPREVKTKEYRDAHRVSWSYHPRHLPKDTNQYHRIVQSAAIKLYNDGINVTVPRLTEAVKARATAGARNIRFVLLAHELFDLAQRKKSSNKTLVSASCGCRQQQTQGARAGQRQEAD